MKSIQNAAFSPAFRSVFFCAVFLSPLSFSVIVADAQTPGAAIAPAFEVIDGKPNEIGAYYRKVITQASSANLGIYSRGGLIPEYSEDRARYFIQESDGVVGYSLAELNNPKTGSRDRPSIYMGGRSNNVEVDAGLAWNRVFAVVPGSTAARATWTTEADASSRTDRYVIGIRDGVYVVKDLAGNEVAIGTSFQPAADGTVTIGVKTLHPNFAFRPFFRSSDRSSVNSGYHSIATAGGANDSQFYAGEAFTMELKRLQTGELRLTVTGGASGAEQTVYSSTVSGFDGTGSPVYKRVDSIDQKGREGIETEPTNATVVRGGWGVTSVLKTTGNQSFAGSAGFTVKPVEFSQNTYNYLFGSIGEGRATRVDGSEAIYINPPNP
jgi:hypothetical protein